MSKFKLQKTFALTIRLGLPVFKIYFTNNGAKASESKLVIVL